MKAILADRLVLAITNKHLIFFTIAVSADDLKIHARHFIRNPTHLFCTAADLDRPFLGGDGVVRGVTLSPGRWPFRREKASSRRSWKRRRRRPMLGILPSDPPESDKCEEEADGRRALCWG